MDTKALKDKILQLAMQGKLVPQDENDEPASILLERIKKEKEQLIKDKKIKKEKALPEITEDEIPYELPKGWEWVRCNNIFNVRSAMRIHKTDWKESGIPFLRGRELVQLSNTGTFDAEIYIEENLYDKFKEKSGIPQKDDILISAVGTIGKVYIVKENDKFYYKDAYILCFENFGNMYPKYIKYMLESQYLQYQIKKDSMATTVAQLTIMKAKSLIMPIPPLYEQKRIVNKLDLLFNLIDELENNKQDLLQNISDVRNKVLQLAVQGKLVPQDENDEPVSVILEKIKKEKEQLIKNKKFKKEKSLPEITEDEIPYELPKGWEWVRLGEISKVISKGTTPKGGKNAYKSNGINFLRVENITSDSKIYLKNIKFIDNNTHENELKRSKAEENDIIISIAGSLGKVAIINKEHLPCNMNQALCFIRTFYKQLNVELGI